MNTSASETEAVTLRRVLFLSSCVRGGGAGWSLYYLLKHLDRSRIEPLVLVPDQGIFRERFARLGLRVITMPAITERSDRQRFATVNALTRAISLAWNLLSALLAIPRIARLVRAERIEAVYCNNMLVEPVGALAAQLAGVPAILHARNLHEKPAKVWFYGLVAMLPRVRRVIANSSATAGPYKRFVPAKTTVVWNGIDLAEYDPRCIVGPRLRERAGLDPDSLIIGFTGHLIPRKGLEQLIRAAAQVLPSFPQARFVIAGRVPIGSPVDTLALYRGLAEELGLHDAVRFIGFVPDVRPLLRDFDILVLPSLQEPFGRSIIEAMAIGTPVIASAVGGIPEIFTNERDGLLVAPNDPVGLAATICRLLGSPDLRASLAARARLTVEQRFDVRHLTKEIEAALFA